MKTINEIYEENKNRPSDINEHLESLYQLALECQTIAEFGVRRVVSTYAFAKARPKKLICVDIVKDEGVDEFLYQCKNENISAEFYLHDSRTLEFEDVDLIFIDTLHNYLQLKQELAHLGNKAKKYLAFHDTVTFGYKDEFPEPHVQSHMGLIPAIEEFLEQNPHWKKKYVKTNCNGLTVLERSVVDIKYPSQTLIAN